MAALSGGALLSLGLGGAGHAPVEAVQPQMAISRPVVNIAASIDRWNGLRQTATAAFENYASFILDHRGWPGEMDLRRKAERQIVVGVTGIGDVVRYFSAVPALTAQGQGAYALALQATGRQAEAIDAARKAWAMGPMPDELEQRLLGTFGAQFRPADHDQRIDALLSNGERSAAQRLMAYGSPQRRAIYDARIALQTRSPDAFALVANAGAAASRDPGLLYDRAAYMNRTSNPAGARALFAQRAQLERYPAEPEKFMELMVQLARGAENDGQSRLAYDIASKVDDLYPAGTDISTRSYGERDEYTNLTWLAGMTAMRNGRPGDAAGMFDRYGRASASPQSRTKGLYWAGKAAAQANQAQQSQAYLQQAARNYDQFYGQLAADRLGRPLGQPAPDYQPTPNDRIMFENKSLVAAARHMARTGSWTQQSLFLRALADNVDTDADRTLAAELGRQIGRPDLGVLVSRQARRNGESDVHRWGFPELRVPPSQQAIWPLVHGITRQESLFDRQALSSAGARGLMQLMPGTAREVSNKIGLPYSQDRLFSDPDYNVQLGSSYFASLLDQWGGSYPLAVASYNAGPGNVRRWVRENGDPRNGGVDMVEWIERIPFFETRNYVQRVLENAVVYELLNPQAARSPANGRVSYYLGMRAR